MKTFKKIILCFLSVLLVFTAVLPVQVKADVTYSTEFPNTWNNTGKYIEDLIGVAMTQVGYYGNTRVGTKYGAWYGENYTYAQWCAMFVAWCANEAGIPTSVIMKTAKANNFRNSGTYHYKDDYTPKRGDLVLYNPMTNGYSGTYYWPEKNSDGTYKESSHVAIVCSYDSSTKKIWVVHGNSTDDKVCYNSILVSSNAIQAFVTPAYSGSSSSGESLVRVFDYVNGDGINMRTGAGTSYSKVTTLDKGLNVDILETVTNSSNEVWYKVKVISTGTVGYVRNDFITLVTKDDTPTTHYVNGDEVRLRSKAGTDGDIVGTYDRGTVIKLLGVTKNDAEEYWYKVKITADGKEGYIRNDLIKIVTKTETPYVNDDTVRLRSSDSTAGDIVGEYDKGTKVEIIETVTNSKGEKWHKVIVFTDKVEGYIRSDFISADKAPETPNYDYTNVSYSLRSAPGTENSVVAKVDANVKVTVLEAAFDKDGDKWFLVRVLSSGKEGYIYYKRVTLSAKSKDTINASCNLVSAPDGTTSVCSLSKGDTVTVLGTTFDGKGNKFFKVSVNKNGKGYVGYIPTSKVTLYGLNRKDVVFKSNLESPTGSLDYTEDDVITVRGWVFSNVGEAQCYYSLDGGAKTPMSAEKRTDVNSSYSTCTTDYAGFKLLLNAKELSHGEHTVEIFAGGDVTVKRIYKFSINVMDKKAPEGSLIDVVDIDESGYTLVVTATDDIGLSAVYTKTTVNGTEKEHIANLIDDDTYHVRVKTSDFDTSDSTYVTKVFARDGYNNVTLIKEISLNPKQYEPIKITFDANGGSGAPEDAILSFMGNFTIEMTEMKREGMIFVGWSSIKDGNVEYIADVNYVFTESTTLYAVWSDVIPGDCNNDGEINTVDLAKMKLALCFNEYFDIALYDFDSNGVLDTVDLAKLKLYLAGIK